MGSSSTAGAEPEHHEHEVDVLVVGSGAGGLTAALRAHDRGLSVLVVEKAGRFGGSSALSGGGLWIPGAPAQVRGGHRADRDGTLHYLEQLTEGLVGRERLVSYVDNGPAMMAYLEAASEHLRFVWKPGYPDYYPELPGGSAQGSVINVPQIDLRLLGDDQERLLPPPAVAPKGFWIAPNELVDFYRLRQSWKGKRVFLRLLWRMVRARLLGERYATMGQSLVARLLLALRERDVPLWASSPMTALLVEEDGRVVGARVERDGAPVRVAARHGVVIASGGFEHNAELRREHQPMADPSVSLGAASNTGDGILAAREAGAGLDLLDSAWWYPAVAWRPGNVQFSLNERMMASQLIVNGAGERYINEAAPYQDFGQRMIRGEEDGVPHIPSWLIMDERCWRSYVVFGHLPLSRIPFAPVPTGRRIPDSWLESGSVAVADDVAGLAAAIGVPAENLHRTVERYNALAEAGRDDDFHRGKSVYERYYADVTLPAPNLAPLGEGRLLAFRLILSDLGTNGGIVTDERARALRGDGSVIPGLYATGNATAAVMGRSYAGAGATLGPAMTFGYVAADDIAERAGRPALEDAPGSAS
ncbi:FAD-dependent oxidoreductase [Actinomadura livida]|uniref:3-oxosteroid 1-dehydrogenase n=1 Tax=Actinomadura livida TaxID=79909 RepID=A0A7W7MZK0_9ACTN|nr:MULTISPECIES: FAD-dependent oxidoreductase [Actinomadura]MBB4775925.1 putative oxidoreductase [Actinomadura catellatispora]GGU16724.1 3-ketosteroid-delta-1-dehydrogenase [Actinomadura livida]